MGRPKKQSAANAVKDIRRKTRRKFSAEEKIRVVLEGLRGEESVSELCRREGFAKSRYYSWSKEFLEAGRCSQRRRIPRQRGVWGDACGPRSCHRRCSYV